MHHAADHMADQPVQPEAEVARGDLTNNNLEMKSRAKEK